MQRRSPLLDSLRAEGEAQAVARRSDPETSWSAAQTVYNIRESQARVYVVLSQWGPLTDDELIGLFPSCGVKMSFSGARTRRKELTDLGLVERTKEKRLSSLGNPSIVWRAVPFYEWERRRTGQPLQVGMF